jgi:glycosyltransferase involved in cell wall biosynthesis
MVWYFKILYRKAALGKAKIITVSEFSKKRIMEVLSVKKERIAVVPNGLSHYLIRYQEEENNKLRAIEIQKKYQLPETYILSLSTLEPRKNLRILIEAYTALMAQGKLQQELVLAGRKGWMIDDLLAGVEPQVRAHIHFTGFVQDEDLPYVYRNASMFVFPSLYEGFGVPPVEAMYMGAVVISSDASSLPEVLGDAAVYFKSNQKLELEKAILHVCAMTPEEKAYMVEKGKEQAMQYTWEKSGKKLLTVLEGIENETDK